MRTGLCVIRHAVKDPIDLHSNCVPVGPSGASTALLLDPIPELASGSQRGGPVIGFVVAGCPPPPPHRHTAASIHTDMFTHTRRQKERESSSCVCDSESYICTDASLKCGAMARELATKKVLAKTLFFLNLFFSAADISVDDSLFNPSVPGHISIIRFCSYFSFASATGELY